MWALWTQGLSLFFSVIYLQHLDTMWSVHSLLTKRTAADRAPPQRTETRSVSRSFRKTHRNPKRPFQYYSRSLPPTMGTPDGRISMTEHCGGASKCWKVWGWETHRILPKAEMGNFFDYKLEEFPAWFLLIQWTLSHSGGTLSSSESLTLGLLSITKSQSSASRPHPHLPIPLALPQPSCHLLSCPAPASTTIHATQQEDWSFIKS